MSSKPNRKKSGSAWSALIASVLAFFRSLARQSTGRSGRMSGAGDDNVVEATRRRPAGPSQPGGRQTADRPERRK